VEVGFDFICPWCLMGNPRFKQMILDAQSTDVVYTNKVTGIAPASWGRAWPRR